MKFLIDTNVFIPLEPTASYDLESCTSAAIDFARLTNQAGSQIYLHPASRVDIQKDKDEHRRKLRELLFTKYPLLPNPPSPSQKMEQTIGAAKMNSNNWVDHQLLAALVDDAIDFLITDDKRILIKARKLGLEKRAATVIEAVSIVRDLFDSAPPPPPAVEDVKAHQLDERDPIFNSFRDDYPGFDAWLQKCKREHRQAWRIAIPERNNMEAVCIVNRENDPELGLNGKILKICTFKVSEQSRGFRFGELLLKTIFEHAWKNNYDGLFLTAFKEQRSLIDLIKDFGFRLIRKKTKLNELIFVKELWRKDRRDGSGDNPLSHNIRYGPISIQWDDSDHFVIPIQPHYHSLLFPEWGRQPVFWPDRHPFGNSIRKAYLSHSRMKSLTKGALLFFYRSDDRKALTTIGICEDTLVSDNADTIARFVGKRTVYSYEEIKTLCRQQVIAILFRQSRFISPEIHLSQLLANQVLAGPPQSIVKIKEKSAYEWLQKTVELKA